MVADSRLNLLLTHEEQKPLAGQAWYQTLQHLLAPMGVRTFEATSGPQAVELIEKHPIHLAVVDSRLPTICGLNVLRLIQKLNDQPQQNMAAGQLPSIQVQMHVEEQHVPGQSQRRIQVRFDARPAQPRVTPAVILIAPPPAQQDTQLLKEALTFNAFSVLSEPVDVNLMLETMARALRRFHQNQWPTCS